MSADLFGTMINKEEECVPSSFRRIGVLETAPLSELGVVDLGSLLAMDMSSCAAWAEMYTITSFLLHCIAFPRSAKSRGVKLISVDLVGEDMLAVVMW